MASKRIADEMAEILGAENEAEARYAFLAALSYRSCIVTTLLSFKRLERPRNVKMIWLEVLFQGEGVNHDADYDDDLREMERLLPNSVVFGVLNRLGPIRFRKFLKYVPKARRIIEQAFAKTGLKSFEEIVFAPILYEDRHFISHFYFPGKVENLVIQDINTLTKVYFGKWGPDLVESRPPVSADAEKVFLNPDELDVMRWLVAGKSASDTAVILNKSYQSVRYTADKVKDRLGFASLSQTLVCVAKQYHIDPLNPEL